MNKPTARPVVDAERERIRRMTLEELIAEASSLGVAPSVVIRKLDPPRRSGMPGTLAVGM